jgi:Domain of unknown function (DUF6378)
MTNPSIPSKILAVAAEAVGTDRPSTHGDAVVNHGCIAIMWNAYITAKTYAAGGNIDTMKLLGAADAAQMMVLFKVARTISGNPQHADHYVDQAGYSALAARMWGAEPEAPAPTPREDRKLSDEEAEAGLAEVFDMPQVIPDAPGINDDPMAFAREQHLASRKKADGPIAADDDGA